MHPSLASIASARQFVASGDIAGAERCYREAIDRDPENVEAWEFLIRQKLSTAEILGALALLDKVPARLRLEPNLQLLAGNIRRSLGDYAGAEEELRGASRGIVVARLHLASLLDEHGRGDEALMEYFGAIMTLQQHGACLDENTTPPALRGLVAHAMRRINQGRIQLFQSVLAPHVEKHGRDELERVENALLIYLGERPADYADPRQRPTFFYVPGLPPTIYYPLDDYPWIETLEQKTEEIRCELSDLMRNGHGIEAVHQLSGEALDPYVKSRSGGNWNGAYFYRHGLLNSGNAKRCPLTFSSIESLPLARVRDHGPEVLFSVLDPGTEILPHRGVTNSRLVLHLPLIVPPDCALDVSGEVHYWKEGRCVMFDDTFEHRAWNRSTEVRTILIMDVWNPNLRPPEREAIAAIVAAVGDFNRGSGI